MVLVEKYPVIAEVWRYIIETPSWEIRMVPLVESTRDLPPWVPDGARFLVGFWMNEAAASPHVTLSAGIRRLQASGRTFVGWTDPVRERIAQQANEVRHWQIIEGDYHDAGDTEATWFIDPPYNNRAGRYYVHHTLDYQALGRWCKSRRGQLMVCENEGADWLPFEPFAVLKAGVNGKGSREVLYRR